jgi:MYXO-CTERM domain-containing protein
MRRDLLSSCACVYDAMQRHGKVLRFFAALLIVLGPVCKAPALAGIIPTVGGVAGVSGGGTASVTGPFTPFPNNAPAATSANFAAIQKTFTSPTTPIDIVFNVNVSGGTTEYLFAEGVFNASGLPWNDYHVQLGFGTGGSFALANPSFGLSFDNTPLPSSVDLPIVALTAQDLGFSGGLIPTNSGISLSFTITVPDIVREGNYQFTLRQYPSSVPEPASAILAAVGLIGLGLALLRRRR